jgi:hypothetical protein
MSDFIQTQLALAPIHWDGAQQPADDRSGLRATLLTVKEAPNDTGEFIDAPNQ